MTNKERYKQAFSVLHTSDQFSVEVENMSRLNKKHNMKLAAAALAGWIFLAGGKRNVPSAEQEPLMPQMLAVFRERFRYGYTETRRLQT